MRPEIWLHRRTFDYKEFGVLEDVVKLKEGMGKTVSLVIPTLNEAKNIGFVIKRLLPLRDKYGLVDEFVLVDSGSTDKTREIAGNMGIEVYLDEEILPRIPVIHGKGENLWRSLYVTKGDIIVWVDADIINMHPRFVYGLVAPLLVQRGIRFSKGFYKRPIRVGGRLQKTGGGRVTQLTAFPAFDTLFSELTIFNQPLSGEYAIERETAIRIPYWTGYGVETGMLIDLYYYFGLEIMAQVNLRKRVHRNQDIEALRKMSTRIFRVALERAHQHDLIFIKEEIDSEVRIVSGGPKRYHLVKEELIGVERPPMIAVPEYREKFGLPDDDIMTIPLISSKEEFSLISLLTDKDLVFETKSRKPETLIKEMVMRLVEKGRMTRKNSQEAIERVTEQYRRYPDSVAVGKGVAISHLHSYLTDGPVLVVARSVKGIRFNSVDNKSVHLIFMLLVPTALHKDYLNWMASIARLFGDSQAENRRALSMAKDGREFLSVIRIAEQLERLKIERDRIIG